MPESKGTKSSMSTIKLMIITVILVFALLSAVILAFSYVHKKEEEKVRAARDTEQYEMTVQRSAAGDQASSDQSTIYIVKGDDKSSNKYERIDRLSYTDSVKYTIADLELLDANGLRITRNEIYARHGRMFNNQDMQEYFNRQTWYVPQYSSTDFDESCFNEVESYNADLIRSYELQMGY